MMTPIFLTLIATQSLPCPLDRDPLATPAARSGFAATQWLPSEPSERAGIYFLRGEDARGAGMLAEARQDYTRAALLLEAHAASGGLTLDGIGALPVAHIPEIH
jgi:hypothetical protein